ncbi:MAG: hypothetical protein CMP10_01495 [Zetaproteobacteria bacterium]|nr:hypothetical protein [Pseudobdellovibrionaceae bacterium]|tara:strand:+ start:93 stop:1094 length:1002 start_codon:yes stop_codon:yes gene_type:complete
MTTEPQIKGLILAAGFGTRLMPFTEVTPKPLFPFFGPKILDLALFRLQRSGINHAAVNTHHLASKIEDHLTSIKWFTNINISNEKVILGTGGSINPIRSWIGDSHLVIYNSDIVSTIDISKLVETHFANKSIATMCLLPSCKPGKTPIYTREKSVISIEKEPENYTNKHSFTGVHIISPEFINMIPKSGESSIITTYINAIKNQKRVSFHVHKDYWHDLGIPKDFYEAQIELLKNPNSLLDTLGINSINTKNRYEIDFILDKTYPNIEPPVSLPKSLKIPSSSHIGPNFIMTNIDHIPEKVRLKNGSFFFQSQIADGEEFSDGMKGFARLVKW